MSYKLKEHVTSEMLNEYLNKEWHMADNQIEHMIPFNANGVHSERIMIMYCDYHGDELDFTLTDCTETLFDTTIKEFYQDLIEKGWVEEV